MGQIKTGQMAPVFTLPSTEEQPLSLKDFRGQIVAIYFYPVNTVYWVKTLLILQQRFLDWVDNEVMVLGISSDGVAKQRQCINDNNIAFPLLSDINHEAATVYGVWQEKAMEGKKHWVVEPTLVIVDGQGVIREIWQHLRPEEYVDKIDGYLSRPPAEEQVR